MSAAGEAERVSEARDKQAVGQVSDHRRISLSSGPSKNPAPPPRSQESQAFLLRALCVAATALLCELAAARWRRNASFRSSVRLLGLLLLCCFLLISACRSAAEEKLSSKVHRKLCEKLEDSFKGCRSAVKGVWMRVGVATEVGFGLTVLPPQPAAAALDAVLDKDESSGGGAADAAAAAAAAANAPCGACKTAAEHLLAMEWVLLRFQLLSFMPWSDVRRIPRVRVGGLSIHITESLSSSTGRRNSTSGTCIGRSSSSSGSATKGIGDGADGQSPTLSSSTSSQEQSLQHFDRKDSWEHLGRRASVSRSSYAGSDLSASTDGYELERVAQATLEHALGHDFAAKYQMYTEEAASIMRRLSRIFVNLMKRYVLGEIVLQDMSIRLSAAVWRDLTSSFFQWEGASAVRELLPAHGVEFRFDVSLTSREMGCSKGSRTALEIVTALTKRIMLQLGRVMLSEARRALFNRKSVVEIFVNSLILNDASATVAIPATSVAGVRDGEAAGDAIEAPTSDSRSESATLVGVLATGVSTLAKRRWVSDVLTVLKHALFKAITIADGGGDPDEGNQGLAALLAHSEVSLATASGAACPPLTTSFASTGGQASVEGDKPNASEDVEGRHPRRRRSLGGGSGGFGSGGGGGGGGSGGGGGVTPRSRRRRGRGFRDVEGEAIAVAAKVSELVMKKDMLEALRVVRLIQVAPLLEELTSYTTLGPKLRRRKIDVDYIVDSMEGKVLGDLMDGMMEQLKREGVTESERLMDRLRERAARDLGRLRAKAGMGSVELGQGDVDLAVCAPNTAAGAIEEEARLMAAMATQFGHAFTAELTAQDVKAFSKALEVVKGFCQRRKAAKAAAALPAVAPDAEADGGDGQAVAAAAEADVDGDRSLWGRGEDSGEERENAKWNLEKEVDLLSKDPEVFECLQHATYRLGELARAAGVYVDAYMAISVVELGLGGLLQRLPGLLPVVQTTIQKKNFTIGISNLNLSGVKFPASEIRLSFRGTSLPARGSIVETNTPFGRGRVVRYMKRTHSLCVELLNFPLHSGRDNDRDKDGDKDGDKDRKKDRPKFARLYVQPRNVVVVDVDSEEDQPAGRAIDGAPAVLATSTTSSQPSSPPTPPPPGPAVGGSGSSRPSFQSLAAAKTIMAASSLQQKIQERRRRASDGDGSGGGGHEAQRHLQQRRAKEQQYLRQLQQQRRRRPGDAGDGDGDGSGSVDDSFWATTSSPSPPPTNSRDRVSSGDGSSTPTLAGADGQVVAPARAADEVESTATREIRQVEESRGPGVGGLALGDRATGNVVPAVVKRHMRGNTEPESFLGGAGGGSGVTPRPGKKLVARRRSSEIPVRPQGVLWAAGAEETSTCDGFLDHLRGGEVSGNASDRGVGKAVDVPNRKSRTWPKAPGGGAGSVGRGGDVGRGGAGVDHVGDSRVSDSPSPPPMATAGAGARPATPPGRGGLASGILGSGVWKKAYATAANVTAVAASATAAATSKAINSDIAASATAMAASFSAGGGGAGGRWGGPGGGRRSGSGSGEGGLDAGKRPRRGSSRGGGGKLVEEVERSEVDGGDREHNLGDDKEEDEEKNEEAPPFLSISVGDVSCYLPNVRWSVKMQQKRFLRVGDSGSVNVWLDGVSLSLSLDPGAGASSLRPSPAPALPPSSSLSSPPPLQGVALPPRTAAGQGSDGRGRGSPSLVPFAASSPSASATPQLLSAVGEQERAGGAAGRGKHGGGGSAISSDSSRGAVSAAVSDVGVGVGASSIRSSGGDDGGGGSSKRSKFNSVSTALSKGTGKLKRRLRATATATQQQQPATSFFQPATSFFPPPSPTPLDAPDLPFLATPKSPVPRSPTPAMSPATTEGGAAAVGKLFSSATAASQPLASSSSSSSLFDLSTLGDDNGSEALAFQSVAEFSPAVAPGSRRGSLGGFGDDEETSAEGGDAGASSPPGGFLKVTACSCKVGSIRIEVDGSKHDGFYNFLAKGLGDTIRDAVREAVERAFAEEIGKLVGVINDRVAEIWTGTAPESKKPARVICAAVRAKGLLKAKGKTELYVKVRLLQKDGTQLEKRSTAAVGPVVTSAIPLPNIATISIPTPSNKNIKDKDRDKDKEADATRSPCWAGLKNDLSMNLPEEDAAGLSLVFEVWQTGTLANGLVGSTRRIPITEIEAPSPAAAAAEAAEAAQAEEDGETREAESSSTLKDPDNMWLEVDSGGDLLVKLAVSGLAAHRRRNSNAVAASEAVSADFEEATDSQRVYRRWD
eukprot:g10709.t1